MHWFEGGGKGGGFKGSLSYSERGFERKGGYFVTSEETRLMILSRGSRTFILLKGGGVIKRYL